MKIGIIGHTKIRKEKCSEFEEVIKQYVELVRLHEPGTEFFKVFRSREHSCEYMFMELYSDEQALELHRKATYLNPSRKILAEIREDNPTITVYDAV